MEDSYYCGQEVMVCKPFTYIVKSRALTKICDFCLKSAPDLLKCAKCKSVFYCENNCQKKAWNSHHKNECALLNNVTQIPPGDINDNYRNLVRTILKLKKNSGNSEFVTLPTGQNRYFKDLMSHKTELAKDSRMKLLSHIYNLLQISFESAGMKDILPTKSEVLEIWGRLLVNQFDITLQIGK